MELAPSAPRTQTKGTRQGTLYARLLSSTGRGILFHRVGYEVVERDSLRDVSCVFGEKDRIFVEGSANVLVRYGHEATAQL